MLLRSVGIVGYQEGYKTNVIGVNVRVVEAEHVFFVAVIVMDYIRVIGDVVVGICYHGSQLRNTTGNGIVRQAVVIPYSRIVA